MSGSGAISSPIVVVTGANGFVGSHICAALVERGATVRAVVRRAGTAPVLEGVHELVGEFYDRDVAEAALEGATAAVTTAHPMMSSQEIQHRVAVEGTAAFARVAEGARVSRLVHISTAAVYDRSPAVAAVQEDSRLIADDANAYAVSKRDADAALGELDRITRILLRPPAILGAGDSSVWNSLGSAARIGDI